MAGRGAPSTGRVTRSARPAPLPRGALGESPRGAVPALPREPERFAPLAAGEAQRSARGEVGELLGREPVRRQAPDPLGLPVALIPLGAVHGPIIPQRD